MSRTPIPLPINIDEQMFDAKPLCSIFNYPSELLSGEATGPVFGFDVSGTSEITEDAEFEIIEPKQLPCSTL